jgi:hypothetical protein
MEIRFARTLLATSLLVLSAGASAAADAPASRELPAAEGGVCPVDPSIAQDRSAMMERLAEKLRQAESAQGTSDFVVLNGRGYRYESDRTPQIARELQLLEVELQRAKAAARREAAGSPTP